jgi:protein-tyrosine phosphatase
MGNICRSPLLEGWARAQIPAVLAGRMHFDSAGTGDWHVGQPPDRRAIAAAARHGVDISGQRARVVTREDFRRFDLLLCADRDNLATLRDQSPAECHSRIALVLDWTGVIEGGEVPDPYQGDASDFDHVCGLAAAAADGLMRRLSARA